MLMFPMMLVLMLVLILRSAGGERFCQLSGAFLSVERVGRWSLTQRKVKYSAYSPVHVPRLLVGSPGVWYEHRRISRHVPLDGFISSNT